MTVCMNIKALIKNYFLRRREKEDLLSMDSRMLNDIGISRVDAEYHAGRFRRDEHLEDIYYNRNEKARK